VDDVAFELEVPHLSIGDGIPEGFRQSGDECHRAMVSSLTAAGNDYRSSAAHGEGTINSASNVLRGIFEQFVGNLVLKHIITDQLVKSVQCF